MVQTQRQTATVHGQTGRKVRGERTRTARKTEQWREATWCELTLASHTKSTPMELEAGESETSTMGSCSSIVTTTLLSSV